MRVLHRGNVNIGLSSHSHPSRRCPLTSCPSHHPVPITTAALFPAVHAPSSKSLYPHPPSKREQSFCPHSKFCPATFHGTETHNEFNNHHVFQLSVFHYQAKMYDYSRPMHPLLNGGLHFRGLYFAPYKCAHCRPVCWRHLMFF